MVENARKEEGGLFFSLRMRTKEYTSRVFSHAEEPRLLVDICRSVIGVNRSNVNGL